MSDKAESKDDSKQHEPLLNVEKEKKGKKATHMSPFSKKTQDAVENKINIKVVNEKNENWDFLGISTKAPLYKTVFFPFVETPGGNFAVSYRQLIQSPQYYAIFRFFPKKLHFALKGSSRVVSYISEQGLWTTPVDLDMKDGGKKKRKRERENLEL